MCTRATCVDNLFRHVPVDLNMSQQPFFLFINHYILPQHFFFDFPANTFPIVISDHSTVQAPVAAPSWNPPPLPGPPPQPTAAAYSSGVQPPSPFPEPPLPRIMQAAAEVRHPNMRIRENDSSRPPNSLSLMGLMSSFFS